MLLRELLGKVGHRESVDWYYFGNPKWFNDDISNYEGVKSEWNKVLKD